MMARIRQHMAKEDKGFTLIELLVVMIIIGILAAIAIPIFLSQRKKAEDSAAKADVSTLGKEIATYWVDGTTMPAVGGGGRYTVAGVDVGKQSANVTNPVATGTNATDWCVSVTNPQGDKTVAGAKYSAQGGLEVGTTCSGSATATTS